MNEFSTDRRCYGFGIGGDHHFNLHSSRALLDFGLRSSGPPRSTSEMNHARSLVEWGRNLYEAARDSDIFRRKLIRKRKAKIVYGTCVIHPNILHFTGSLVSDIGAGTLCITLQRKQSSSSLRFLR